MELSKTWHDLVFPDKSINNINNEFIIGILPGEGIGPEVTSLSMELLESITPHTGVRIVTKVGDKIGKDADLHYGKALTDQVIDFCAEIFDNGGAILNGPGGGRYVYDLRKRFDLYLKISPLQIRHGVAGASRIQARYLEDLDILVLRENSGGIYQGIWNSDVNGSSSRQFTHSFEYKEDQVIRFLDAAGRISQARKGHLTVVWKESGVPGISELWKECTNLVAEKYGITYQMVDVDLMAYSLIHNNQDYDVIATPNLMGDIIGDLGAVLLGSRGVSYSGNYGVNGEAVYQTNHGSAHDLVGKNIANPAGQMLSLAMLLRQSFGLNREASLIEKAIADVWNSDCYTEDLRVPEGHFMGTREWTNLVIEKAYKLAKNLAL